MRLSLVAAGALLALESAALACSCISTDDPAELKRFAAEASEGAVALVEVEVLSPYDRATGRGEVLRVVQTLAGRAPLTFQVPRAGPPFGASCDLELRAAQREVLILYPSAASPNDAPAFRISGLCTDHLLEKPVFRNALIRHIGGSRAGERG